jgi:hypothetical protein
VVDLLNSTVSGNEAAIGGGIFAQSTLAVNYSTTDSYAECVSYEEFTSAGYSLYGSGTGCDADGRFDLSVDPATVFTTVIKELDDNGGDTLTHALILGSGAFNAADDDFCPATDQRGVARPQLGARDVGSYELQVSNTIYLPLLVK